jgi:Family of unknown function (DUF5941)
MTTSTMTKPSAALSAALDAWHGSRLLAYRDDGPIDTALSRLTRGKLPPLLPLIAGALIAGVLMLISIDHGKGPALVAPVVVVLLAGPAAANPHKGRLDWLVPPIIRVVEYGYLATLGFSLGVSKPLVYVLIGVLAFHHYDTVYRTRQKLMPPPWLFRAGLGWEGRILIAAAGVLIGAPTLVYAVLATYLGVLYGSESVYTWTRTGQGSGVMVNLEEEEEARS